MRQIGHEGIASRVTSATDTTDTSSVASSTSWCWSPGVASTAAAAATDAAAALGCGSGSRCCTQRASTQGSHESPEFNSRPVFCFRAGTGFGHMDTPSLRWQRKQTNKRRRAATSAAITTLGCVRGGREGGRWRGDTGGVLEGCHHTLIQTLTHSYRARFSPVMKRRAQPIAGSGRIGRDSRHKTATPAHRRSAPAPSQRTTTQRHPVTPLGHQPSTHRREQPPPPQPRPRLFFCDYFPSFFDHPLAFS